MKFQYYNPIRFHFGTDAYDQLPELCEGHKVMLVYGGGSIKENGVYDRITTLLKEHGIPYVDYGGQTGASCVNTMGVFRSGVDQFYPWTLFSVGYIPRVAHQVSYREALVVAYLSWLKGISQYHMSDIRTLFTEVFCISASLSDESIVDEGCAKLKKIMEEGEISVSLSAYGSCPTKEYIAGALNPEDFGEFTQDEMYEMIAKCYA